MHTSGPDLILAATDLSNFLACGHLTTLDVSRARGGPKPRKYDDPSTEVLRARGHEHEAMVRARLEADGLEVVEIENPWADVPYEEQPLRAEQWRPRAEETLAAMRAGVDVIHQGCLFDGRWVGFPDFLLRVDPPGGAAATELGAWSYEVIDAKLSREAKAGAVLQITLYSAMLAEVTGVDPERMHLALGRMEGAWESFRYHDFAAYMRSVRGRMGAAVEIGEDAVAEVVGRAPTAAGAGETEEQAMRGGSWTAAVPTYPEPRPHCDLCDWREVCRARWREDDHLSLVAGITRRQRGELEDGGVDTLAALGRLGLLAGLGWDRGRLADNHPSTASHLESHQ